MLAPDGDAERAVGPALLWADRIGHRVEILVDPPVVSDVARRSAPFADQLGVWAIDGTTLRPAEPGAATQPPVLPDDELAFVSVIEEGGGRPVDDHGRLVAEFAGLEVARVTRNLEDEPQLEVGVGQADRELQHLVHGQLGRPEALARAIELVAEHRTPGAPMHPLNRLARERWLRSTVLADPALLDLSSFDTLPPLRPRSTVLGTVPIAGIGQHQSGQPVIVVCFVGIDTDLVVEAVDYRTRHLDAGGPPADLVVVVPERDHHALLDRQAASVDDITITSLPTPWSAAADSSSA